uniref:Uncharacterized protein n=1 Tax=Anopheles atroparvus TaxID=41427 RepID=A0A182JLM7_ANOAO
MTMIMVMLLLLLLLLMRCTVVMETIRTLLSQPRSNDDVDRKGGGPNHTAYINGWAELSKPASNRRGGFVKRGVKLGTLKTFSSYVTRRKWPTAGSDDFLRPEALSN